MLIGYILSFLVLWQKMSISNLLTKSSLVISDSEDIHEDDSFFFYLCIVF